jgi:hypothetical protein
VTTTMSSQWHFVAREFEGHGIWCMYGDIANDASLANVKQEDSYQTLCACCAHHLCPQYVELECETKGVSIGVDYTT